MGILQKIATTLRFKQPEKQEVVYGAVKYIGGGG